MTAYRPTSGPEPTPGPGATASHGKMAPTHCAEERIYALWDELADFSSAQSSDALKHCMGEICHWIDAQNAFWAGTVRMVNGDLAERDPVGGWRIGAAEVLNPECTTPERMKRAVKVLHTDNPSADALGVLAGAGRFRVHSLGTGLVKDLAAFKQTEYYEFFYAQRNIHDRIWAVFPVNDDTEAIFFFDSYRNGRRFSAAEMDLVGNALRGIKWFHRQQLLSRGLGVSNTPLSSSERRVLPELLSGDTEKVIAERMGLTPATVHQYTTAVYRKFGVRGRTGFMALWLNGRL